MARETSTAGLQLLLAMAIFSTAPSRADEDCPPTAAERAEADIKPKPPAPDVPAEPPDERVTIEADDDDFKIDADGNAVVSGNVVLRQGDKVIRGDRMEYNAQSGQAKIDGAVEFT
ncbi:MAG TPA: LptA/OstA family protein, partial [Steroidobacteraceae bacterium]